MGKCTQRNKHTAEISDKTRSRNSEPGLSEEIAALATRGHQRSLPV